MLVFNIIFVLIFARTFGFTPILEELNYGETYEFHINSSREYILQFKGNESYLPPRVTIESPDANKNYPLLVAARQPKGLLSWELPLLVESDCIGPQEFLTIARTLCNDILQTKKTGLIKMKEDPIVSISTVSPVNVTFLINVDYQKHFYLKHSKQYNFTISPSEPRYFYYNFTANDTDTNNDLNYRTVVLEIESSDMVCMIASIQNVSCPVLDLNQDITYRGFYATVSTRGGITIPRYKFPFGFYLVLVAKPDDSDCTGVPGMSVLNRNKNLTIMVKSTIGYNDYLTAIIATLSCIAIFYIIFGLGYCVCVRGFIPREMQYVDVPILDTIQGISEGEMIESRTEDTEYDLISEASTEKAIRYSKPNLSLKDLAKKDPRVLIRKSYLYLYNVLTVALFYGLPVIQLVVTYQRVLNETGEQDLCYYNFLCAHPLGSISDFNHVFSNIAYILLGILFIWLTHRRERTHKDWEFDKNYGIPQHFGMFYAMGVSLIMEGVLSASYHICPNHSNFQFDSSFMYVMAVLCIVKLYQNRHPDINATAYATFGVLAITILFGMIGILEGNIYFWVIFTIIYILSVMVLSIQVYYLGCWKFDRYIPLRIYRAISQNLSSPLTIITPNRKACMVLLIIGNLINFSLAGWGVYDHQKDFALFLLAVFMVNTLLYFFFYIIMKCLYREKVSKISWTFLICSICCASSAMYFFMRKSISWALTPAQSRQYNQECKLLMFYDDHDIWHFLSATGMFFTFMVLLTLDDDLSHTHRNQIPVF